MTTESGVGRNKLEREDVQLLTSSDGRRPRKLEGEAGAPSFAYSRRVGDIRGEATKGRND